jgi:hypothetical protein
MRWRFLVFPILVGQAWTEPGLALASVERVSTDPRAYVESMAAAESASARGHWDDASKLWEELARSNPHDGRNWDQLANACFERKDYRGAITAWDRAIELGYWTPNLAAIRIARCWALLGEREKTIAALQRAFDLGFNQLGAMQRDSHFTFLHDDARFRTMAGLVGTTGMSRIEGWRADLSLVDREVKRRAWAPLLAKTGAAFDREVRRFHDAIPKLSDARLALEMKHLLATVGDGHTNALVPDKRPEFALTLPLKFYLFEEGLFVVAAAPAHRELLGAQVTHIEGREVEACVKALEPYISHEPGNEIWYREQAPFLLRHPGILQALELTERRERLSLSIRDRSGKERKVEVAADTTEPNIWNKKPHPDGWTSFPETLGSEPPPYLRKRAEVFWFEKLPKDNLVYAQINNVRDGTNETLAAFSRRLLDAVADPSVAGLVIDLRWNNGGNTGLVQPLVNGLIGSTKLDRRGTLFVITGRRTFSAAQNLATYIEQNTNAIFVGEPTGSSPNFVGEEMFFTLPYSGLQVNVSDRFWQSSWPIDRRTWIAPTLYAPPTFAAYQVNRDPAMEAIQAFRAAGAAP